MTNSVAEARDSRGEWKPDNKPVPGPLFRWPLKPLEILKYLFGYGGLLWRYNALYVGIAVVSWFFLTPGLSRLASFAPGWIALLNLRNAGWLILIAGGLHVRLYIKRAQGTKYKYSNKWPAKDDKKFLFKSQTKDNPFWSLVSGCTVRTGYEALTLWAYANDLLPYADWRSGPGYFVLVTIGILFFRQIHFYWIHRFTHWKPLYRAVHYLNRPEEAEKERVLKAGSYFHYLHHRFFTVNFGYEGVPLDRWFGSFHDGSPEAHEAMMEMRKRRA